MVKKKKYPIFMGKFIIFSRMQHFLLPVVTKQDAEEKTYAVFILGQPSLQMCNIWCPSACE